MSKTHQQAWEIPRVIQSHGIPFLELLHYPSRLPLISLAEATVAATLEKRTPTVTWSPNKLFAHTSAPHLEWILTPSQGPFRSTWNPMAKD